MFSFGPWRLLAAVLLTLLLPSCGGTSRDPARTTAAELPVWNYVALGNSLAAGAIAQQGYVPRYADHIRTDTGKEVRVTNLAVSGWRSSDLLNAIRNDARMRAAVQNAQVITFDIGGNDLLRANRLFLDRNCGGADNLECFRTSVAEFHENWDAIVAEIVALRRPDTTVVRTMNIYNPFVALQRVVGTLNVLRPFLDQVNSHIAASAAENNILMADIYSAFNGPGHDQDAAFKGWMSFDGVHPDDEGHAAIAEALRATGYAPLR
jgi:lysophospholipase L1-like esterase